ncbi:hypothetical protein CYFUS_002636 [Cystobacter fuscus]|uniref:Uncharacterized protein n=1 Tax=Cystobacter fuscus TaxID=43 RepID=A0A250IZR9_9BACT|nr:hypothetical protein [Cystobacter fuscus]ATB37215.1 hypothetical protein CYFUS_002636 [Cystobacter fuscus]
MRQMQLSTSGNVLNAPLLRDRLFDCQEWNGEQWEDKGKLAVFENTAFLNGEKLHHVHYHNPTGSLHYSFGKKDDHRSGRFFFTEDHLAFTGTVQKPDGTLAPVRGNARESTYDTQRRSLTQLFSMSFDKSFWTDFDSGKADDSKLLAQVRGAFAKNSLALPADTVLSTRMVKRAWVLTASAEGKTYVVLRNLEQVTAYVPGNEFTSAGTFSLGTEWVGEGALRHLKSIFKLDGRDVSDRTAVVKTYQWQTTISMAPSSNPFGDQDQFTVVIDYSGHTLAGTYTDASGNLYDWKGRAQTASLQGFVAKPQDFIAMDKASTTSMVAPMGFTSALRAASALGPDLSVQDLMNVSSVTEVVVHGQPKILDTAQTQTGKYFQDMLVNALDDQWVNDFFGSRPPLPPSVQKILNDNKEFFQEHAVMNLGQMVHDAFDRVEKDKDIVKRIDVKKLSAAWESMGTNPGYVAQSSPLYAEGYRVGVPGIQPYLENNPKQWAQKLYEQLTSAEFLNVWAVQVANQQFKNVRQQMYEWNVQLSVLDPDDQERPQKMLTTMFAVIIGSNFNKMAWDQEIIPYLKQAIQNMLDGKTSDFSDEMLKKNAEAFQKAMKEMVSTFNTMEEFTDQFVNALNLWAGRNNGKPLVAAGQDVYEAAGEFFRMVGRTDAQRRWENFKDIGGKVFGAVLYGAAAGYLIYKIVDGEGLTPIEDINLALLATGFFVKGIEKLLATGIGDWIHARVNTGVARLDNFAKDLTKWFSEDGVVAEGWAMRIFGKNSAEFFAERLGPAIALVGIALSAFDLYKAIKSGDTRDIVFESLNTFFALAGAVLLGFELASFAWAGPLGIAVAVVGLIVAAVQLIWNIIDPPPPPPDPVQQFVDGPLKAAGFVLA